VNKGLLIKVRDALVHAAANDEALPIEHLRGPRFDMTVLFSMPDPNTTRMCVAGLTCTLIGMDLRREILESSGTGHVILFAKAQEALELSDEQSSVLFFGKCGAYYRNHRARDAVRAIDNILGHDRTTGPVR
jgi:hypothetical protein